MCTVDIGGDSVLARLVETSVGYSIRCYRRLLNRWGQAIPNYPQGIVTKALPTIIDNVAVLIVNLIGYSAMAGAIGGGGLGDIAIRYGYQRFQGGYHARYHHHSYHYGSSYPNDW